MTTVIYRNTSYRFIGYANLPGSEVLCEHGGKFYRFPVSKCQLVKNVTADKHEEENVSRCSTSTKM
jgi:hypothetical protein